MTKRYVALMDVRPKVIALLQHYGPTEAVAEVAGVTDDFVRRIYSREGNQLSKRAAEKIDEAYKKIPQRRQPSRDQK